MAVLPPGVHADFPPAEQLTPMLRQYAQIKAQQPDVLLFYRLGDFYELFGPDAVRASGLLGLTLTARAAGKDYKVAMCGVPHHSSVRYIKRLVDAGETVAICEQLEDSAAAKGLVERGITRVITAGTLVEDEYLAADSSNFLVVLAPAGGKAGAAAPRYGIAVLESSGGRVELREWQFDPSINHSDGSWQSALAEAVLNRYPAELLVPGSLANDPEFLAALHSAASFARPALHSYHSLPAAAEAQESVLRHFQLSALDPLGLEPASPALLVLSVLLRYLRETFRAGNIQLHPQLILDENTLQLDPRTVKHLELTGSNDGSGSGGDGLYGLLNRCASSAGRRELKRWLLAPTADLAELSARQAAVELLIGDPRLAELLERELARLADIERIAQRISLRRSNPKELRALANSLPALDALAETLADCPAQLLAQLGAALRAPAGLHAQLDGWLAEEPPLAASDGGVIRAGMDSPLEELRELSAGGTQWFTQYEEALRASSGIRALKVKHTGPIGWFIEIGKVHGALAPREWERRGTLVNAERFTTPELREREAASSSAQSRLAARERELLEALYAQVEAQASALARCAWAAARLDILRGLAALAREQQWCRTELVTGDTSHPPEAEPAGLRIELEAARHPLVEASVGAQYYSANDGYLDQTTQQVLLLTGPNMGGKSSYLRMIATLCIINQLVGFIPARSAALPLLDRIFTRIGAHDALARGQSTFMVEMLETARILRNCTPRSLLVLDEVGRGTSTYDGISIAKAVLEHLHEHPARPLTLFATHFFELTDLAAVLPRVANFQVEVARGAQLIFTYRVLPGAASDSFGIDVARQAGLPASVIDRAAQVLAELEEAKQLALAKARQAVQLGLFAG